MASDRELLLSVIDEQMTVAGGDFSTRNVCAMLQEIEKAFGDNVQIRGEVGVLVALERLVQNATSIKEELERRSGDSS